MTYKTEIEKAIVDHFMSQEMVDFMISLKLVVCQICGWVIWMMLTMSIWQWV